jgi:polygalacturonase
MASVYDVTDYGATGNGSTLDTDAINAAVAAADANGGGVVYFPDS